MHGPMHARRGVKSQWPMRLALIVSALLLFGFSRTTSPSNTANEIIEASRSNNGYRRVGLESQGVDQQTLSTSTATKDSRQGGSGSSSRTVDDTFRMSVGKGGSYKGESSTHISLADLDDTSDDDLAAAAQVAFKEQSKNSKAMDNIYDDEDEEDEEELPGVEEDVKNEDEEMEAADNSGIDSAKIAVGAASESAARSIAETRPFNANRFPKTMPFVEALETCDDLECVHDAHYQPKNGAKFNFPDFLIIGWQKTATTSLYSHLARHLYVLTPSTKEPEVLTSYCHFDLPHCPASHSKRYIKKVLRVDEFVKHNAMRPIFEGSTHIVRGDDRLPQFATQMRQYFPWLKLIASTREPISRAISMLVHIKDKATNGGGCLAKYSLGWCLLNKSQITVETYNPNIPTNYSYPLEKWLEIFPREQFFLIQYEELTSEQYELETLRRVKEFIGVDPEFPRRQELPLVNSRKFDINPEGHPIRREEYEALIEKVRPDVDKMMELVEKYKFGDAKRWRRNWESVWERNLASCDENGDCLIQLS